MRRLVLVRHGESSWNRERRIQGQAGTGLSELGVSQVQHAASWLAGAYPDAAVVSSDLQRCRETVAPIAAALGADVTFDEALRERDFGHWSGRLLADVEAEEAERWARWTTGQDVVAEVGGEASDDLRARVVAAFERILRETPDDGATIVVTHGGPVWHGTHALLGFTHAVLGGVANASVTEIGSAGAGAPWLQCWNQVAHLPADLVTSLRPSVGRTPERAAPRVGR
ncbi:MAG: histidine phosphatase family protein [Actinobacteria bacterium]|nr:histidine phosphatase family protein [Actinomycetota bacterium]